MKQSGGMFKKRKQKKREQIVDKIAEKQSLISIMKAASMNTELLETELSKLEQQLAEMGAKAGGTPVIPGGGAMATSAAILEPNTSADVLGDPLLMSTHVPGGQSLTELNTNLSSLIYTFDEQKKTHWRGIEDSNIFIDTIEHQAKELQTAATNSAEQQEELKHRIIKKAELLILECGVRRLYYKFTIFKQDKNITGIDELKSEAGQLAKKLVSIENQDSFSEYKSLRYRQDLTHLLISIRKYNTAAADAAAADPDPAAADHASMFDGMEILGDGPHPPQDD